jgi:type IV secretory pathway VirB10-like protein
MKPRSLVIFIIVAGIAGAAAWWLFQTPAAPAPEKVAETPPVEAPKPPQATPPPPPAPRVEAPAIKPVQAPAPAPEPVAAQPASNPNQGDPQLNLDTAIADICTRAQAGDLVGLMEDYISPDDQAKMPPGQFDQMKQMMQTMASSPQGQQMLQQLTQAFQGLQDQTPTYNDAGDRATYTAIPPGGTTPQPITFKKVDGRWYADMGAGGGF